MAAVLNVRIDFQSVTAAVRGRIVPSRVSSDNDSHYVVRFCNLNFLHLGNGASVSHELFFYVDRATDGYIYLLPVPVCRPCHGFRVYRLLSEGSRRRTRSAAQQPTA